MDTENWLWLLAGGMVWSLYWVIALLTRIVNLLCRHDSAVCDILKRQGGEVSNIENMVIQGFNELDEVHTTTAARPSWYTPCGYHTGR